MELEEVKHYIEATKDKFLDSGMTANEFTEMLGISRIVFYGMIGNWDSPNASPMRYRFLRRLCRLINDAEIGEQVQEWLKEVAAREEYEDWHDKKYTKQIKRKDHTEHARFKNNF